MIKVVIDTNVIVSGFFWSGPPKTIVEKVGEQLLASPHPNFIPPLCLCDFSKQLTSIDFHEFF
jgi:hypothetical protein